MGCWRRHRERDSYRNGPLTFNCVPEAFRGGGVVGRCVKNVNLQAVCYILGLWEALHHGTVDISCWVPPDGRGLCA